MVTKLQNANGGKIDVRAVVKFFGGRTPLSTDLRERNIVDLTPQAIAKWMLRGSIPAARRIDLETLARMKRRHFEFSDFAMAKPAAKKKAS